MLGDELPDRTSQPCGGFMNRRLLSAFIAGAVTAAAALPALAGTCYEIIDRNGAVVLRDAVSPVDLSMAGAPAREAMRNRGELLVIFDTDSCMLVGKATATGSRTLTTDEIVAGWKSMGRSGFGGTYGSTVATDTGGGVSAPPPRSAGASPPGVAR
jgi:hypothetical protein